MLGSNHHWETIHKGFYPRGDSPVTGWYCFGPTGIGDCVHYRCQWCPDDSPYQKVDLTIDEDDTGDLIVKYDENWKEIPWAARST